MSVNSPLFSTGQVASGVPFDNTGINFNSTDVQAALLEVRDYSVFDSATRAITAAGSVTLTSADKTMQFLTGSAVGYTLQLPAANTLFLSTEYTIINQSSQTVQIKDGSGANLFVLSQTSVAYILLQLNGSAAGTWVYWQNTISTASGIVSYNVVTTTPFATSANADTLITSFSVTPQAGTYSIWYDAQNTASGAGAQLDCTVYKGGSAIVDSKRSNLSTAGTHIFQSSTQTISQFDGTQACDVRVNANGNSMTVGARSLLMIRLGT